MTGFVYAIAAGDAVKIGFSRNPKVRFGKIKTDVFGPCRMLGFIKATMAQERELHALLAPEREHGEWFRRGPLVGHFLSLFPARSFRLQDREITSFSLERESVERAKKAAGGATMLARKLTIAGHPITPQAVSLWRQVPPERVGPVSQVTGIPVHELRPDLWPEQAA